MARKTTGNACNARNMGVQYKTILVIYNGVESKFIAVCIEEKLVTSDVYEKVNISFNKNAPISVQDIVLRTLGMNYS